jgi:hypothetical protein
MASWHDVVQAIPCGDSASWNMRWSHQEKREPLGLVASGLVDEARKEWGFLVFKRVGEGWRNDSMAKSTDCSS